MDNPQILSATSILSLFQTDKEQRQTFITDIMNDIREGNKNPMEVHLQIKCMEELIEQLTSTDEKKNKNFEVAKEYKKYLFEEATKLMGGAKSTSFHNAKFEVKEVGTKYDFTNCNDPKYVELLTASEKAKKELKDREDFLKKAPPEGTQILVDDEVVIIYPPSKSSTTAIAVSLK